MNARIKLKVMDSRGITGTLTDAQVQAVGPIFNRVLAGQLSLRIANDMIIAKLDRMKTPVRFDE